MPAFSRTGSAAFELRGHFLDHKSVSIFGFEKPEGQVSKAAEKYRKRAEAVARELKRRSHRGNASLLRKKGALEALAENEDWLAGEISPEPVGQQHQDIPTAILRFVAKHPGLTEAEITRGLARSCGPPANHFLPMIKKGLLDRRGNGGAADPYRYFVAKPVSSE